MASVEAGQAAGATTDNAQIWDGEQRGCKGKFTKRHCLAVGALAGGAVVALGLFFGLSSSSNNESGTRIVGQATDPNAVGCVVDDRSARIMTSLLTDEALTPTICDEHCASGGYAYYGVQWGKECWCGAEGADVTVNGEGVCDYPCAGDSTLVCGGYLAMTVYEVGVAASVVDALTTTTSSAVGGGEATTTECTGTAATVRIASTSGIAYFEGGGCATLTDMYNAQGTDGPLYTLDAENNVVDGGGGVPTGFWLLTSNLRVVDGVTLEMHGTSLGGDCDVLRIKSDGSDAFYELRGHGGSLSFKSTTVTSWDTSSGSEQTDYEDGRSFINCVSEGTGACAKNNMGECRMDIIDSTMGNLGWFDAESYGLTWKVRGFCADLSNPEVFDVDQVYGDIQGSEIYGMYYGMYSYGHQGGVWTNNIMRDNILYGFDPHDDSDDLTIANNKVYGNGNHGIIASKRCNNVEIYDNEVYDGGEGAAGIFLHRSSDSAKVYGNYIHDMLDAGFAILESMDADIHDNVVENVKYGIRISLGGSGNQIYDNSFDSCSDYGFYTYQGSDEPDVSDGRPSENVFTNNVISNTLNGVKLNNGDANEFIGNDFTGATLYEFSDSEGIVWQSNIGDACAEGAPDLATGSDTIPSC